MKIGEKEFRSIWLEGHEPAEVVVIDQRRLPFTFDLLTLRDVDDIASAISTMAVRGAPLIGAAAAWGIYLSFLANRRKKDPLHAIKKDAARLKATRPTAVNLSWAVDLMTGLCVRGTTEEALRKAASDLCDSEVERCRLIGGHGLPLIEEISRKKKGEPVNILTHCNAGWLACIDYGTALAPVYLAHEKGIRVHVWVDETRPRNQGSRLTAWELMNQGVPCTLITDNAGGHLMQNGMVDIVIAGCDRATANGDVANKIGTYLKAVAAHDNNIPFYSAFPVSSFDMTIDNPGDINVEERNGDEVRMVEGLGEEGLTEVLICKEITPVSNFGFDVTPARLITGLITDRGVCRADKESIIKILS